MSMLRAQQRCVRGNVRYARSDMIDRCRLSTDGASHKTQSLSSLTQLAAIPSLSIALRTVMVTDIMATSAGRAPDLGTDHRAIVWCRNLLLSMRTVIFKE
jgi:hypothetical protein